MQSSIQPPASCVQGPAAGNPGQDTNAHAAPAAAKPVFYMGDSDDGDVEPMKAHTLKDAVKEAKKDALERAADTASSEARTALQDWVVYSVDSKGELCSEEYGIEHADPKEPKCPIGRGVKHRWVKLSVKSHMDGSYTAVLACSKCDMKRIVQPWASDGQGGCYDIVSYKDVGDNGYEDDGH